MVRIRRSAPSSVSSDSGEPTGTIATCRSPPRIAPSPAAGMLAGGLEAGALVAVVPLDVDAAAGSSPLPPEHAPRAATVAIPSENRMILEFLSGFMPTTTIDPPAGFE
ncbi:hypothetical protein Psuf_046040 [Phytohabitans suffuscus]|uniref:Uncharacterized protein n=1 Tax=Phytohabitans suffuscus TaxID=624315 RepID=A0A6F8YMY1_9ACTN|nr:hypothetical protein Psuf_046040 [Phytohabitans suffuscus]